MYILTDLGMYSLIDILLIDIQSSFINCLKLKVIMLMLICFGDVILLFVECLIMHNILKT